MRVACLALAAIAELSEGSLFAWRATVELYRFVPLAHRTDPEATAAKSEKPRSARLSVQMVGPAGLEPATNRL